MNGRPVVIPAIADKATAILETWWLGTETGNAIADVLWGDYNPAGKLPMSFPRSEGQIPVFYNEKSTGRPFDPNSKWTSKYIDEPNSPQWPFGYGLSYTTFAYANLNATPETATTRGIPAGKQIKIRVNVQVTNTGKVAGEEVVQLYIRDVVASTTRPVKALKGFQKVMLSPGETKKITFNLTADDLSFYRSDNTFGMEPGAFDVMVGGNSSEVKMVRVNVE
jgi:beta-glucosidase